MATFTRRAALTTAVLAAGTALAGCQSARPTSSSGDMSPDDLDFVANAYNIIEFDRQECVIAQTQARTPEVRALAAQLLQQANDFDERLRPIAASAGIKPPAVLRTDLRVRAGRLRLGQGLDFDRAFIDDQIVSHQDALNLQEMVVSSPGTNPQLQALSRQGTETIRTNLAKLQELQGRMRTMRRG